MATIPIKLFIAFLLCNVCHSMKVTTATSSPASELQPCGSTDWQGYDDKCFQKISLQNMTNKGQSLTSEQAADLCRKIDPSAILPTISSPEEQAFLTNLLPLTGSLWMGGRLTDGILTWEDGVRANYTNWSEFILTPPTGEFCVLLERDAQGQGNWTIHKCNKNYVVSVVCQKTQIRVLYKMKAALQAHMRRSEQNLLRNEHLLQENVQHFRQYEQEKLRLMEELDIQTNISNHLTETLATLNTFFPIGFIYIQYRDQAEPSALWPTFNWTDVSAHFAGEFFRAAGGNSDLFGSTQNESYTKVSSVEWGNSESGTISVNYWCGPTPTMSRFLTSGALYYDSVGLRFTASGGEVRPPNSAVRIWKRSN